MANRYSRFANTPRTSFEGRETLGVWRQFSWLEPDNLEQTSSFVVPNSMVGRPDKIAHQVYGTPHLDWAIIAFNAKLGDEQAQQVLNWPRAGQIIQIPSESVVVTSLIG